jgi:hypothetical protein
MVATIATVTTAAGAIGTAMTGVAGSATIDIMVTATITGGRTDCYSTREAVKKGTDQWSVVGCQLLSMLTHVGRPLFEFSCWCFGTR